MIIFSGTIVKKLGSISRWFKSSLLSIDMRYQGSELPNEDVWEALFRLSYFRLPSFSRRSLGWVIQRDIKEILRLEGPVMMYSVSSTTC